MTIVVVPYDDTWPGRFAAVERALRRALDGVTIVGIEHVGSTSVPGLASKPILDIDVVVGPAHARDAVAALGAAGYTDRGDLGVPGRISLGAPDDDPARHVYVCVEGSLSLRNHLAVRDVLRRDGARRDEYAAVKVRLAAEPGMTIETYVARKSDVLAKVLELSDLTPTELAAIRAVNELDV